MLLPRSLAIVPVKEEEGERTDNQEEQDPHPELRFFLDRLQHTPLDRHQLLLWTINLNCYISGHLQHTTGQTSTFTLDSKPKLLFLLPLWSPATHKPPSPIHIKLHLLTDCDAQNWINTHLPWNNILSVLNSVLSLNPTPQIYSCSAFSSMGQGR